MNSAVSADSVRGQADCQRIPTVRKAVMRDTPTILGLINGYATQRVMLPRTEFELSETIRALLSF